MLGLLRTCTVVTTIGLGVATALAVPGAATAQSPQLPTTLQLPNGFQPEGIAIGPGPYAYFGSLADGSIYRINLATGAGSTVSPATGTLSVGLQTDAGGRLFVAGGFAGDARVIDTRTGAVLASYQLATGTEAAFVNDVVLTPTAAYFTDSYQPVLYELPLDRRGNLPAPDAVRRIALTGDLVYQDGMNANGITRTPDGRALIIVQSNTGRLFRVDPATGNATGIDLGTESVPNGDGLLLLGRTLYVVQNQINTVAEIRLCETASRGTVTRRLTDPRLDFPTTVAAFGNRLYLPNARFTTTPEPTTSYTVVAIER